MRTFRTLAVAVLLAAASGCADDAASNLLPEHVAAAKTVRTAPASGLATPRPAVEIDLPALAADARRVPAEIARLRRTVFWAGLALCVVGLANAALLLALLDRRPRPVGTTAERPQAEPALAPACPALVAELRVASNPYGYLAVPPLCAGVTLAYAGIPRQPAPVLDAPPRAERRRCACGAFVAPRARARRCEACAAAARPKRRSVPLAS